MRRQAAVERAGDLLGAGRPRQRHRVGPGTRQGRQCGVGTLKCFTTVPAAMVGPTVWGTYGYRGRPLAMVGPTVWGRCARRTVTRPVPLQQPTYLGEHELNYHDERTMNCLCTRLCRSFATTGRRTPFLSSAVPVRWDGRSMTGFVGRGVARGAACALRRDWHQPAGADRRRHQLRAGRECGAGLGDLIAAPTALARLAQSTTGLLRRPQFARCGTGSTGRDPWCNSKYSCGRSTAPVLPALAITWPRLTSSLDLTRI